MCARLSPIWFCYLEHYHTVVASLDSVDKALERSAASGGFVKFLEDVMRQAFHNIRLCSKKTRSNTNLAHPNWKEFHGWMGLGFNESLCKLAWWLWPLDNGWQWFCRWLWPVYAIEPWDRWSSSWAMWSPKGVEKTGVPNMFLASCPTFVGFHPF